MTIFQKILYHAARLLLGVVFLFSGFVKSVDPQGFAYKLQDYFTAFGLTELHPIAYTLAFLLVSLELYVGLLLLFSEWRKVAAVLVSVFMLFFTPLTLYLALANPVSDCGCFGDAVKLTNWETFWKNVPLLLASLYLLKKAFGAKPAGQAIACTGCRFVRHWLFPILLALWALFPAFWATVSLPMIDFRPYHIGANLREAMRIPDDAPKDEYQTEFVYEKDGVQKTFSEFDYPWDDSTWHYVSSENRLVQKGYEPPIHDFALEDETNSDHIPELLDRAGVSLLVVTPFLESLSPDDIATLNAVQKNATTANILVFHATASSLAQQHNLQQQGLSTTLYTTNERTLKTIVRAATGVVLLKDGVVMNKWSLHGLPSADYFASLSGLSDTQLRGSGGTALVYLLGSVLLLLGVARLVVKRKQCKKEER